MTFNDFLTRMGRRRREKILARLHSLVRESAIMQQMVQNLFAEPRLQRADWASLATALVNALPGNKATENVIRDFCRDRRCLRGGLAEVASNVVYGRVVYLEQFCETLLKLGYHSDVDEAKAALRFLIGMSPSKMPSKWKKQDIGLYIMWNTFDEAEEENPFGSPLPQAELIVCMLGLAPHVGPWLLCECRLPAGVDPCIPTFCDAYAADLWSRYFRPALPGEPYGRTMPTDTCPVQKGRPEVVHKIIQFENLAKPLRYAP